MNSSSPSPRLENSNKARHVILIYRDQKHHRIGRCYCTSRDNYFEPRAQHCITEWKFEMLAVPSLWELAVADLEESDTAVITTVAGELLPEPVKGLVGNMSVRRSHPSRIVVLLSGAAENRGHILDFAFLREQAQRIGAELVFDEASPDGVFPAPPLSVGEACAISHRHTQAMGPQKG